MALGPAAPDLDGLRLLALGRIPRCRRCPRYRALVAAHARGGGRDTAFPAVPSWCTHDVCAPLVERLVRPATEGGRAVSGL